MEALKNIHISFKRNTILTSEMLDELQNLALQKLHIDYYNFSDGIIKGLDFETDDKHLYLLPGIVKYNGKLYSLESKTEIFSFSEEGGQRFIYLKPSNKQIVDNSIEKNILEIAILEEENKNYIFLGSFLHHQYLQIHSTYENYSDLRSNGGYFINILNRQYSGVKGLTISPQVLYSFSLEKLMHKPTTYLESFIINSGLNKTIVEFDILKKYLGDDLTFDNYYDLLKEKINEPVEVIQPCAVKVEEKPKVTTGRRKIKID